MLKNGAFLIFSVLVFGLLSVSAQTERAEKPISVGVINGRAESLPKPAYPAAAKAVNAQGAVNVQIVIDEEGNVLSATAVSGHPLLRSASEEAAKAAKFRPTLLSGQPVKVTGVIVYNFVGSGPNWENTGFSLGIAESKGGGNKVYLPEAFSDEEKQLEMIGKLSPPDQTPQLVNTIAVIKSKLNPADLWRFEFGLAKGRILSNAEDDNVIFMNLAKIKQLTFNKPEGIQAQELISAAKLAKFADKDELTKEERETILSLLR